MTRVHPLTLGFLQQGRLAERAPVAPVPLSQVSSQIYAHSVKQESSLTQDTISDMSCISEHEHEHEHKHEANPAFDRAHPNHDPIEPWTMSHEIFTQRPTSVFASQDTISTTRSPSVSHVPDSHPQLGLEHEWPASMQRGGIVTVESADTTGLGNGGEREASNNGMRVLKPFSLFYDGDVE
jgi:hypothetical protein